jgi:hypothetical protein
MDAVNITKTRTIIIQATYITVSPIGTQIYADAIAHPIGGNNHARNNHIIHAAIREPYIINKIIASPYKMI